MKRLLALVVVVALVVTVRAGTQVIFTDGDMVQGIAYEPANTSYSSRYDIFEFSFSEYTPLVGYSLKFWPQFGNLLYATPEGISLVDPGSWDANFYGIQEFHPIRGQDGWVLTGHIAYDEVSNHIYVGARDGATFRIGRMFGLYDTIGSLEPSSTDVTCETMEYDPYSEYIYLCADQAHPTLRRAHTYDEFEEIGPVLGDMNYPAYLTRDSLGTANTIYVGSTVGLGIWRITADTGEMQLCLNLAGFSHTIIKFFAVDAKLGVFFLYLESGAPNSPPALFAAPWDSFDSCVTSNKPTNLTAGPFSPKGITLRHTLDPGPITGIVLGSIAFLGLLILGCCMCCNGSFKGCCKCEPVEDSDGSVVGSDRPQAQAPSHQVELQRVEGTDQMPAADAAKLRNIHNPTAGSVHTTGTHRLGAAHPSKEEESGDAPSLNAKEPKPTLSSKPSRTVVYKIPAEAGLTPNESDGQSTIAVEEEGEVAECVVCLDKARDSIVIPCGHVCLCHVCGDAIMASGKKVCPICRSNVEGIYKVFKA